MSEFILLALLLLLCVRLVQASSATAVTTTPANLTIASWGDVRTGSRNRDSGPFGWQRDYEQRRWHDQWRSKHRRKIVWPPRQCRASPGLTRSTAGGCAGAVQRRAATGSGAAEDSHVPTAALPSAEETTQTQRIFLPLVNN